MPITSSPHLTASSSFSTACLNLFSPPPQLAADPQPASALWLMDDDDEVRVLVSRAAWLSILTCFLCLSTGAAVAPLGGWMDG